MNTKIWSDVVVPADRDRLNSSSICLQDIALNITHTQSRCAVFLLLCLLTPISSGWADGDTGEEPQVYFGGIMDFNNAFREEGLPEVNRFRRGEAAVLLDQNS